MKNIKTNSSVFIFVLLLVFIQSCNSDKLGTGFIINANITGIDTGKAMLVKLDLITNERVDVDSATIKNGKFNFNGKVGSPYLHTIIIEGFTDKIHLFLENSNISINGDIDALDKVKVIGSKEDSLFRSYTTNDIFDKEKGMEIMLNYPQYNYSAMVAYYQFQYHNISTDTLQYIIDSFSDCVKKSVYFNHLVKLHNSIKRVAILQPAPDFSLPDIDGNIIELSSFKGKFVLIDFWASWCAPCRESNSVLIESYKRFNKRNFTIIGVSVDKNKERLLEAIETDSLSWTNLSALKGWGSVSNLYGVKAVPQNYLLNPDGIIIDKNIEIDILIEKLNEILPEK